MRKLRLISACVMAMFIAVTADMRNAQAADGVSVFASGFNGPRGLRFGPDGYLYVAEAGLGGTTSTIGQCTQVPGPPGGPGPDTGGKTARISKVSPNGIRTTVADGLPSLQSAAGARQGVSDVAFIDDELYALIAGGGCSHGNPIFPPV
jgi:hypothetical protein